jgi:hypothetical protein
MRLRPCRFALAGMFGLVRDFAGGGHDVVGEFEVEPF